MNETRTFQWRSTLAVAVLASAWACGEPYGDTPGADDPIPRVERDAASDAETDDGGDTDGGAAGATCAVRGVYAVGTDDLTLNKLDPSTAKVARVGTGMIDCPPLLEAAGPLPSFFYEAMAIGRDGHARIIAELGGAKRYVVRVSLATGKCIAPVVPLNMNVAGLAAVRDVAGDVYYATTFEEVDGKKGEYLHRVDPATGTNARIGSIYASTSSSPVVLVDSTDSRLFGARQRTSTELDLVEIDRKTGAVLSATPAKTNGTIVGGVHTPQVTWLFSQSAQAPQLWTFDPNTKQTKLVAPSIALKIRSVGVDVACD